MGMGRRRHRQAAADEGDDHDGQVDNEDGAPGEVLEQPAAEGRADGDAEAGDG